jgi:hypothetical protein
MNRMRIACMMVLCFLFTAVAFAQQTAGTAPAQEQEAKPEKPEKHESAKPEKTQENKEKEAQPGSKMPKHETGATREQTSQKAHSRPAGKSAHIPDDKFRASFGRSHTFVISKPVVVNNQPTFQYGGFTFIIVDPWPVAWAYTDDCYIDFIDGDYFLFDVLHPGVRIALFVVM